MVFFYFYNMIYRKATIKDIPLIQVVRNSVKENQLLTQLNSNEFRRVYHPKRGTGFVCEIDDKL